MWSLLILFLFTAELFFTSSSCPLDMKSHSVLGNNIVSTTQHCLVKRMPIDKFKK